MAAKITIKMYVERKNLFALSESDRIDIDTPTVLVLVESEIVVQHQECGTCRPKTTTLTQIGTQITLESGVTYRVKNNTMKRAAYLVVYPEVNQSE